MHYAAGNFIKLIEKKKSIVKIIYYLPKKQILKN